MTEKIKSLSLSKLKIAETDGERRVTFVASTANEDRDYEIVQIDTFRLPIKGGGHIKVSELGSSGSENVDIPLLTNHKLSEVEKTIGSVRRASYVDGKLIFEAGISSRPYAQDVFKLIEEGHLDNAFSIQYGDYDHNFDTNTDTNGEIIEVSMVTRGSNRDAQVLAIKAIGEDEVKTKANDQEQSVEETTNPATEPVAESGDQNTSTDLENQPDGKSNENAEEQDVEEEAADDEKENESLKEKEEKKMTTAVHTEIARKQVKAPSQIATSSAPSNYLKSKQAEHDFAQTIVENYGRSGALTMKAWENKVRQKGITGDAILPERIETIFFKGWEDHYEAIGTFARTSLLSGAVYAWNTDDRAMGHRKGDKKAEETVNDVRRDYKYKVMYKKLSIDLQDLLDDQTGELLRFRNEELNTRMGDELVRAVVFSDGRSAPTGSNPDYRIFDGTRGPWSMVGDLNGSTTAGSFSAAVATVIPNVPTDTMYQKIIKTRGAVKGGSGRKIVFVPEGTITDLLVATKENGEPLFAPGTDFQNMFGVYIFESPYMTGSGYDVIAYREGSYLLATGDMMVRTAFDLEYNTDVMLQERAVAGTAFGHKVIAGYKSATAAASASSK